jgi:hypothetical protein
MKKMKQLFFAGLFLFCLSLIIAAIKTKDLSSSQIQIKKDFAPVAVLELFTSQGCSSCPPADELLGQYVKKENEAILPLSFHVDYWNYLGWKDIFSSAVFSERQKKYAAIFNLQSVYTPQIVINGNKEYVGSNGTAIAGAVQLALQQNASVQISAETIIKENVVFINYTLNGNYKNNLLNIAVVETKASVPVKAGENSGAVLTDYNIVRSWNVISAIFSKNKTEIELPKGLPLNNEKLILYMQDRNTYAITGAVKLNL